MQRDALFIFEQSLIALAAVAAFTIRPWPIAIPSHA